MPCFCPPWELFYRAATPLLQQRGPFITLPSSSSSSSSSHPPRSLLPQTQTSLYLPIMCSLSLSLFSLRPDPVFYDEHTHTHTHMQSEGGKDWFWKPAKYFIHGHAICLCSLIPIWCYLLSLSSRGFFFFFLHILFSWSNNLFISAASEPCSVLGASPFSGPGDSERTCYHPNTLGS